MTTTLDLLAKALSIKKAYHWAIDLQVQPSAITNARKRGRLSPTLAGRIANALGQDDRDWIALAGLEAEPATPERDALLKHVAERVRILYFSTLQARRRRVKYGASGFVTR